MDKGKEPSLEERMKELGDIATALERGEMGIDEAIAAYERGMQLSVSCRKTLDEMSRKVAAARNRMQELQQGEEPLAAAGQPSPGGAEDGGLPF
ncbi:MAG: exodeoxyribonuclease VII small subunit [Succinivibrionaceae bacterium]|nr:exodeoxyribonuclease VII small subunit [Succinivibrionaceae bacterium]